MRNTWYMRWSKIMEQALVYGFAWAGICCLFDYSMWEGNIMSWYWEWLDRWKHEVSKSFGLCISCFCFWFGAWYLYVDLKHYFIFLGVSQFCILTFYLIKQIFKQLKS